MKKTIKKIILIIILFILIISLITLYKNVQSNLISRKEFEKSTISFAKVNAENKFSIDKIVLFSSSDCKNKTSSNSNFTIENLYAYTDIAIFINNNSEKNTLENTLKNVKIKNIKFTSQPQEGNAGLYYKSVKEFAKGQIDENNKINDELQFEITSESEADFSKPILFNNCANPITLCYINQNIKTDYTMTDVQNPITYNGKLLKRCGVSLDKIEASVAFDIEIENNKNQKYTSTVYFDIPYKDGEKNIYDGNLTVRKATNFNFCPLWDVS